MGFSGLWSDVLQVISGRRRGANGRFCRGIPRFLSGVRARRGGSAHGGHGRGGWAKKFFKNFYKRGENPKNWGARGAGRWPEGTLYRVCEVIFRHDL